MSAPAEKPPTWQIATEGFPDLTDIVIDDGEPVDGRITEKNMRLLTEPLYASWAGPGDGRPFEVMANVGVFHTPHEPPIVPDVLLVVDVVWPQDLSEKANNSYFVWLRGKVPDVAIEIVSNTEGGEEDRKMEIYARIRVPYYVIFDPDHYLSGETLRVYELRRKKYVPIEATWLKRVGLGLKLWQGLYEGRHETWLRWCGRDGNMIPTGAESAEQERQRADAAAQELERLRADLRARGIDLPS